MSIPPAPAAGGRAGGRDASARPRIAVVEANRYHAEVIFGCASAAAALEGCDLHVFAPDVQGSRAWLRDHARVAHRWSPVAALEADAAGGSRGFDLVVISTFPADAAVCDASFSAGSVVLGLVHEIGFFSDPRGARAALERHPTLQLAYVGVAPPEAVRGLPAGLRERVVRFVPVFHPGARPPAGESPAARRRGVALPGMIEFSRRDYPAALRAAADAGVPLNIFGRSQDTLGARKDLERLLDAITASRIPAELVSVTTDTTCAEFYQALEGSRFVAVMTVNPDYLRGKLTAAVTAAVSLGVPMLMRADVHAYFAGAEPALFARCATPFDPAHGGWGPVARDMPPDEYEDRCHATLHARDLLIGENSRTLRRLLG